ncbi:hypothetical protein BSAF29S_01763 [Bacillus safensis subsp. safensis]
MQIHFRKKIGEKIITLVTNGHEIQRTVTGIYQDVTNGGKTAKAISQPFPQTALWQTVQIQLKPGVNIAEKKKVFEKKVSPAKVTDEIIRSSNDRQHSSYCKSYCIFFCISCLWNRQLNAIHVSAHVKGERFKPKPHAKNKLDFV